ncbi:hypothetical protein EDB85DRAFT_1894623 [Lactarius pseudohatsudake]|nr:hypothetical protein EDB85DRAFT_1894623 [Lactarius pseudohatsudake]
MPKTPSPPRRMSTRASNKTAHPGNVVKPKRRTTAQVQEEKMAKAKVKEARKVARQQGINRAAEFEHTCLANEDLVDATPRPLFTPKRRHNQIQSDLTPISKTSDSDSHGDSDNNGDRDGNDDRDGDSDSDTDRDSDSDSDSSDNNEKSAFKPLASESSDTRDNSTQAVESDVPPPPGKKLKGAHKKAAATRAATKATSRKNKRANKLDAESADAEPPQEPKPKKIKLRIRDEINVAAKKMEDQAEDKSQGNRYADMVKLMSGKRLEGEGLALKGPPQPQAMVPVGKKSDGAIKQITATEPNQASVLALAHGTPRRAPTDAYASEGRKVQSSAVNCEDRVPRDHAKPTSQGPSRVPATTSSRSKSSVVFPLTSNSTRLSVPSALTNNINIVSHGSLGSTKVKAKPLDVTLFSEGGLSDADETNGIEREAAVKSPPKGKRRATNEQLIVVKTEDVTSKKPRNEGLPDWTDARWFRHTFVTTYMAFVGQTADPWDVPIKQAVEVMQKIWDATNGHEYEITSSSAVCQKAIQRLADSWRNVIGSIGISSVQTFCDSQDLLRDSDSERQKFASYYLEDLRFLYEDTDHEDKKKWKGLFRSPFILQTFAAHLGAIEGSQKVPDLHEPNAPTPLPIGALGLAAAAVERALTLIETGTVTTKTPRAARGKTLTLPKTLNYATGKDSTRQTGFSDATWGKATRNYTKSARSLAKAKFDVIIKEAQVFMKPTRTRTKMAKAGSSGEVIDVDDYDIRACLVANSDSDCK